MSFFDLRLGRWQDVLASETCDALIFDAPYGKRTHASSTTRADGVNEAGLAPTYDAFTECDVAEVCRLWAPRTRGWMVSITDSELAPVWAEEMACAKRYVFSPLAIVIRGMSVRIQGDGPSSWTLWAVVSRPKTKHMAGWGTLDGAYVGPAQPGAGGGRGKPGWLMAALVRDYSRLGDVVCDPFAGWGVTLAAAVGLGRRAIGAEFDEAAYHEAQRRLARPQQMDLLAGVAA